MKTIDEKGRLFGKVNIVDFLIIVVLIVLIPIFLSMYKILGKTPILVAPQWVRVEAVTFITPEFAALLKLGDISYDAFGYLDGKLIKLLDKEDSYRDMMKNAMINKYNRIDKTYDIDTRYRYLIPVFLELELLCNYNPENDIWNYKRRQLLVSLDSTFAFNAKHYLITCYALKIEGPKPKNE